MTPRAGADAPTAPDTLHCDVAVFGSGAAGLAAALVAAQEGLDVLVFEKADALGGTTATSGGAVWVPGNSATEAAGHPDPVAQARRLLQDELGPSWRGDLVDAYLASGREAIDYLATHTEVRFELMPSPDYVSEKPGAALQGRALAPLPFDGRRLGSDFRLVRAPRPAFMILGGLMIGRREIPLFLRPLASWAAFSHVMRTLARYALDRLRFARGTRLLMGNALVARAVYSALRLGVRFHTGAALTALLTEEAATRGGGLDGAALSPEGASPGQGTGDADGQVESGRRVTGARVRLAGRDITVRASRGVVLATGGFAHSRRLRDAHSPAHPHELSLAAPENTGDAAEAALAIGAVIDPRMESPGFWTPASLATDRAGRQTLFPYGHMDRGKPGAIIVDRTGRRFVNEADSYHHVVLAMFRRRAHAPHGAAFIVCDSDFVRKYGLGLVKPAPFPVAQHVRSGYLRRAATLAELAGQLGVDASGLADEVARHNGFALTGRDADFGKGDSAFNRYNGDPAVAPNPCLAPIVRAPFYAIEIFPCTIGMASGLKTDADARVLDASGRPIAGLYACGNDMASFTRGTYPGPGITIGPALVFAYRAMRHAAASPSRETAH